MKRLLLILILTFGFQSWTKADDIRDFEIEGMSIGDSLLDYFSEEEIKAEEKKAHTFSAKSIQDFKCTKAEENKAHTFSTKSIQGFKRKA